MIDKLGFNRRLHGLTEIITDMFFSQETYSKY